MYGSKIQGANLFVKKIWSLHPTKHKFISLESALDAYAKYLFTIHDHYMQHLKAGSDARKLAIYKTESAKSFKQWLTTEI